MNLITVLQVPLGGVAVVTLLAAASMSAQERLASGISHAALGAIGTLVGVPLGLGIYLVFRAATGGGFTGVPPLPAVLLVAVAAVGVAAAAGVVPALFVPRRATREALAAE